MPDTAGPELVVGLVGAIGTDLAAVEGALTDKFTQLGYRTESQRLSDLLAEVPTFKGRLAAKSEYERYEVLMSAGTELREATGRGDALAMLAVMAIRDKRKEVKGNPKQQLSRHAFILRSLKHPGEVESLRRIYGANFILVSAYTPEEQRFRKLAERLAESEHAFLAKEKYPGAQALLQRDEAEPGKSLGQQVRKTFPLADVFIDTTDPAELRESVRRFLDLCFGHPFHTPTRDEYGMSHAQAAANRSSALGRQVGAAITTAGGDIVVVGTNDVPKPGGGLYWPGDRNDRRDFITGEDINDKFKHRLLADVLRRLRDANWLNEAQAAKPIEEMVKACLSDPASPVGGAQLLNVIEYGRCVHAEMAAVVDAARRGTAIEGCTLYTSTFPCHECARHIVAAGIREVVYIDPYPKSLVHELHGDSIAVERGRDVGGKVAFRPFVGVAPHLYVKLFQQSDRKERDGNIVRWAANGASPRYSDMSVAIIEREAAEVGRFLKQLKTLGWARAPQPKQASRRGKK